MASPSLLQSSASSFHGCFPSLAVPSSAPQLLRSVVKVYASGTVRVEKSEAEKVQRLKTVYLERIIPTLKDEFKYINIHQVTMLEFIAVITIYKTTYEFICIESHANTETNLDIRISNIPDYFATEQ